MESMTCPICDENICEYIQQDKCLGDHLLFTHKISLDNGALAQPLDVLKQHIITRYMDQVLSTKVSSNTPVERFVITSVSLSVSYQGPIRALITARSVSSSNDHLEVQFEQLVNNASLAPKVGDEWWISREQLNQRRDYRWLLSLPYPKRY